MRKRFAWLFGILAWAQAHALAAVPYARDLAADAKAARAIDAAVLIVFVRQHCVYCERVLKDFLIPMSRNADYQAKVVMRRVEVASPLPLRDFRGQPTRHDVFSKHFGIGLTPTVMLFSPQGEPLGKPLIGLTTVDYYGHELDQAIDTALARLRAASPSQ